MGFAVQKDDWHVHLTYTQYFLHCTYYFNNIITARRQANGSMKLAFWRYVLYWSSDEVTLGGLKYLFKYDTEWHATST